MTTARIAYTNPETGILAIVIPTDEWLSIEGNTLEKLAEKDVPAGIPYHICDLSDLPSDGQGGVDRTFRHVWGIDAASKKVNPDPSHPEFESVVQSKFSEAIQAHLDATAQTKQYSNSVSITTYIGSKNPQWNGEADAFVTWRDGVWDHAYTELAKVVQGQSPLPKIKDFIDGLPRMVWPA
jgi:hypothetical protein